MKNSNTIRELIADKRKALDELQALVKAEDRDFTEDEQTLWDEDMAEMERLMPELDKKEKEEAIRLKAASIGGKPIVQVDVGNAAGTGIQGEPKDLKKIVKEFSFQAAVRAAITGKFDDGLHKEMHEEGTREMRAIGQDAVGIVIPGIITNAKQERAVITENSTTGIEVTSFVDGVYANTILGDLGVTRLSSNTDQRIPIIPSLTTQWEGETDDAADGGSAITKKDLSPTRLASFLDYSIQAAMQHNESLDAALRRGFQEAVGAKVEFAVFTDDTGNGGPADIGAGKTPVGGATVTLNALGLVEEIITNNQLRGNLGFAISNTIYTEYWTAVQATGVSPLINESTMTIQGYPFFFSSQIADIAVGEEATYFGDWSKFYMASFGGVEILTDPFTQAIGGKVRLVLNSYWDFVLAQDSAISVSGLV